MSQKSKQQLLLDNQTNFPNNNNGFITPDKLRNFHVDLIDSTPAKSDVDLIQSEVDSLESVLSAEITRAINAENSLSTAIEQSGGDLIQQEISDRISGDISLTNKINVETSQRTSTDISLTNKINTETSDRIERDIEIGGEVSRIQGLIIGEVQSRILVDTQLSTAILAETSQRISGDLSLVNKLSSDYVPYLNANKDLDMGIYTIKGSGLKLNTSNPYIVYNTGDMGWNSTDGTIDLRLLNNTTLQIGQEVYVYAKAIELIENGSVVQYAGVQGDHILVKKARPSEINLNSSLIIGVATQNINANEFGYITAFGKINDVYTTGFNLSDTLYLDMSDVNIYGRLTNIEPSVGNVKVILGNVIKLATGGSENGKIQIRISIGSKLTDLNDVNGTTPVTGSLLTYQEGGYFDFTNNINDFVLDSEVSNMISTGISVESSQRISVDNSLSTSISTGISVESSQRISVDNSLSTAISTEVVARTSSDNSLTTAISTEKSERLSGDSSLSNELSITKSIAKGAQQAISYNDYEYMVLMLKSKMLDELVIGQSIYINTLNVPDLWISNISPVFNAYTYVSDEQLISDINLLDMLQIGYYYVSFLETQKVDLTNYATNSDLSTAISTEESTRISADTSVLNVLNSAISTEASTRLSNDSSLTSAISTEKSERISGDTSLTNRISTETSQRISADTQLSTNISTESSQRISADVSLSNAIANITVTGELANLSDVDVTTKIDDDLLRFDATTGKWINETPVDILESVNSGELLMNMFGVIQGVTPESIVSAVDTSLTTRISTEESTRLAGDSSLSTSISSEESTRISADTSLSVNISTEISDRISGDNSLTSRISSEEINRVNGDNSLSTALSITAAIAKGTQQALSFNNYSSMVSYLNGLAEPLDNTTHIGQSIYINTLDVPDVWISANIFPSYLPTPYSYVSDNQLIADVAAGSGYLQMGYYKISFLETQKVDLTNYATTSALSTAISSEASVRSSTDSSLTSALSTEVLVSVKNNTDTYTSTAAAKYIITLSQAEYDAIGTKNANTLYVVI